MSLRMLLPLKGAEELEAQLTLALDLAVTSVSEVRVLHVTPVEFFGRARFSLETPAEASYQVESAVFELRMAGIGAHGDIRRAWVDKIYEEISLDAAAWVPDVIVLGPSRRGPLRRRKAGSISGRLARVASCPVLVAPAAGRVIGTQSPLLAPRLPR
ncbi:MAG: universal stress protein [Acidimicrobiales bacterium]|jgi:nucleotide-binding universal stress UspA family protein